MHNRPPNAPKSPSPRWDPALAPAAAGWSPARSWDVIPGLRQHPRYPHSKANSSSGWNGVQRKTWQMFLLSPAPRLLRGTRC